MLASERQILKMSLKFQDEISNSSKENKKENRSKIPLPVPFCPVKIFQPCRVVDDERILMSFTSHQQLSKDTIYVMLKNAICAIFTQQGIDVTTNIVLDVMVDVVVDNFFYTLFAKLKMQLDCLYSSRNCNLRHPDVPTSLLLDCIEQHLQEFSNINFQSLHIYCKNWYKSHALCEIPKAISSNEPSSSGNASFKISKGKASVLYKPKTKPKIGIGTQSSSSQNQHKSPLRWGLSSSEEEISKERDDEDFLNKICVKQKLGICSLKTSYFPFDKYQNLKHKELLNFENNKDLVQKRKNDNYSNIVKKVVPYKSKTKSKIGIVTQPSSSQNQLKNSLRWGLSSSQEKILNERDDDEQKLGIHWLKTYNFPLEKYLNLKNKQVNADRYESKGPTFLSNISYDKKEAQYISYYKPSLELMQFEIDMPHKVPLTEEDKEYYKKLLEENDCKLAKFSEKYIKNNLLMPEIQKDDISSINSFSFLQYPSNKKEQELKEEIFKKKVLALIEAEKSALYEASRIKEQRKQDNIKKSTIYSSKETNLKTNRHSLLNFQPLEVDNPEPHHLPCIGNEENFE